MKENKVTAQYHGSSMHKQHCGECKFFRDGQCALVEGWVGPGGWCKHFTLQGGKR